MIREPAKKGDTPTVGRRDLLSSIGFWLASFASFAIIGIPSLRFAAGRSLNPKPEQWVQLGSPDKLPIGDFASVAYQVRAKDAWREVTSEGLIYVQSTPQTGGGSGVLALSAICTHLGCNVRWTKTTSRFACPCHSGLYDAKGEVISGPPPRPLRRLETRVREDGVLEARLSPL